MRARIRMTTIDQEAAFAPRGRHALLAQVSESEVKKLHGMGPKAVAALRAALRERGLSFRN
jgi:hypothetical protein